MERITERDEHGCVYVKEHDYVTASKRLAEYEDTRLSPDAIRMISNVVQDAANRLLLENDDLNRKLEFAIYCIKHHTPVCNCCKKIDTEDCSYIRDMECFELGSEISNNHGVNRKEGQNI